jgi:hypothetical protein
MVREGKDIELGIVADHHDRPSVTAQGFNQLIHACQVEVIGGFVKTR